MEPDRWRQLEELYHAALERPPEERSRFLQTACAGDDALRQEVQSLLTQSDVRDFLDGPTAVTPGSRLGSYDILSAIGKGGMGEVWKARDTKLGREVAIKTLPEEFARDGDRLARFEREAKVLASLNHPNIAAIYSLEECDATRFLVLELVDGDTLADRVKRGPIAAEEALAFGLQIAEALEVAHGKGVIHRDLKPANIKLTPDGTLKVLDFGLAKAVAPEGVERDQQQPAVADALTKEGLIQGTPAYMSPEQVRGERVDKRTDVWAFGCVLYEMLTGRLAFEATTVADTTVKILEREPDWDRLPATLHPRMRDVLRRCLDKERKNRWHDIADVRVDVQQVLADPDRTGAQPDAVVGAHSPLAAPQPAGWRRAMPFAATVIATALVAGIAVWNLRPPEPRPVSRFVYDLPEGHRFRNPGRPIVAFSADGSQFVYNTAEGLYLRSMGELEARLIAGTEEDRTSPFLSPDGQWVGYWAATGQLKKIAISGGTPIALCEATNPFGVNWEADGTILFGQDEGIRRVPSNGGLAELIVGAQLGEQMYGPQLLPGGEWVLFSVTTVSGATRWDEAQIVVQSLVSGERKVLWNGGSDARYVPTGHLAYAWDDHLFAVAFDVDALEVTGSPVSLVEGVYRATGPGGPTRTASANYGVSDGGALVYVTGARRGPVQRSLVWVDREGREEILSTEPRGYVHPRISPDGTRVALDVRDDEGDIILIWDFAREALTRFTLTADLERSPVWTPDGARIAYGTSTGASWKAADGSGVEEPIAETGNTILPYFFSPTGTELVFRDIDADIGMLAVGAAADPVWFLASEFVQQSAELSPDGRWMAYGSNESGDWEIFVRPFPNVTEGRQQVSTAGGRHPLWARNGEELFYLEPGTRPRLMAVPVQTGSTFDRGSPQPLFAWEYRFGGSRPYDVSPDGQRFLVIKAGADEAQIHVVLNWFEELEARVPVPASGSFSTLNTNSGGVTTYCGTTAGEDLSAVLTIVINSATGQASGTWAEDGGDESGFLVGRLTGTSLVFTDRDFLGLSATGTLQGNSLSGTWFTVSDPPYTETETGTFSGSTDNCP